MSLDQLQKKMRDSIIQWDEKIIIDELNSTKEQFEVYANGYRLRLGESIAEDFPEVQKALGAESFEKVINDFMLSAPSRFDDLGEMSSVFPEYLKTHMITMNSAQLIENAELEWLKDKSFRTSYPGKLPELKVDALLILSPGVYLHKNFLIYTYDDESFSVPIVEAQREMLLQLQEPQSIEKLIENHENLNPADLSEWFEFWTKNQIITNYHGKSE